MSRQLTYSEAMEYLRNITPREGVRPLVQSWLDVTSDFDDLPQGVRQALINRLIEIQKDTTSRDTEAFKGLREEA